jgi:hypothetical protein
VKLVFIGRAGVLTCEWSDYALLRDNVQHFIEGGEPSERFRALHAIETAVDRGRSVVDAACLRGEVLRAWNALSRLPLDRAAVSIRTRAILTGSANTPPSRGTVLAEQVGWELPASAGGPDAVADAARRFVALVLDLTEGAVDGDELEVRREGSPPRFTLLVRGTPRTSDTMPRARPRQGAEMQGKHKQRDG